MEWFHFLESLFLVWLKNQSLVENVVLKDDSTITRIFTSSGPMLLDLLKLKSYFYLDVLCVVRMSKNQPGLYKTR